MESEPIRLLKKKIEEPSINYFNILELVMQISKNDLMDLFKECGQREALHIFYLFNHAVVEGNLKAMALLKELGATDFKGAIVHAARMDEIEAMKLLKDWGAADDDTFHKALVKATANDSIKAMQLLKDWGAEVVEFRACCNFPACCNGGTFHNLFDLAVSYNAFKVMKLIKDWSAWDFDAALATAAHNGNIEAMVLLREWGATDFRSAMGATCYELHSCDRYRYNHERHASVIELLRAWERISKI